MNGTVSKYDRRVLQFDLCGTQGDKNNENGCSSFLIKIIMINGSVDRNIVLQEKVYMAKK